MTFRETGSSGVAVWLVMGFGVSIKGVSAGGGTAYRSLLDVGARGGGSGRGQTHVDCRKRQVL